MSGGSHTHTFTQETRVNNKFQQVFPRMPKGPLCIRGKLSAPGSDDNGYLVCLNTTQRARDQKSVCNAGMTTGFSNSQTEHSV